MDAESNNDGKINIMSFRILPFFWKEDESSQNQEDSSEKNKILHLQKTGTHDCGVKEFINRHLYNDLQAVYKRYSFITPNVHFNAKSALGIPSTGSG